MKEKNIRKMVVTPDTGKDFRDTQVSSGIAKPGSQFKAKNETNQYTTAGGVPKGNLGGLNTNS